MNITVKEGYFVCKVVGESMNKQIPNGSFCLFKQDSGGTREGKIVLVKSYYSEKVLTNDSWSHKSIVLKPLSNSSSFDEIVLTDEEISELKIVGIFECVLY